MFLLMIGAIVVVLIVVAVAAAPTTGKKGGKGDQGPYERNKNSQPYDWSKYYNKKWPQTAESGDRTGHHTSFL